MTTRNARRRGFTLLEVLLVVAVLLLLAAVVLPSVGAFRGDSRPQAAIDMIRSELAAARGRAASENRPYRIAIGSSGTRIRRAPDGPDFATAAGAESSDGAAGVVEYTLEYVTAELLSDPSASTAPDGWETIAVVLPDGTCLDDSIIVGVRETKIPGAPIRVNIRGLTATAHIAPPNPEGR